MSRDYPPIQSPAGLYEWHQDCPIEYGSLLLAQAPGWHEQGTLWRNGAPGDNHAVLTNGPTWQPVPDQISWAVLFGASTGTKYIALPVEPFSAVADFSLAMWVTCSANAWAPQWVCRFLGDASGAILSITTTEEASNQKFQITREYSSIYADAPYVLNKLTHLCVTSTGGTLRFYVDGVKQTTERTVNVTQTYNTVARLSNDTSKRNLRGTITDPLFSRIGFSQQQIDYLVARRPTWRRWEPRLWMDFSSTPSGNWSWLNHLINSPYGVSQ